MSATPREAALGIDVGGTNIRCVVWDGVSCRPLPSGPMVRGYDALLEHVDRRRADAESRLGVRPTAVGLGLPGAVKGREVVWLPNLDGFDHAALADDLERLVGLPVWLANDAHVALLGEAWQGAAADVASAALLTIGTGLGGAILVNDRILRGFHGTAGAFGWLGAPRGTAGSGRHGELESVLSGTALNAIGQAMVPPLSSYAIIDRARAGDPDCLRVVEELAALLGRALATLASTLDPELLVISGGLSDAFDLMERTMRDAYARFGSPMVRDTRIVKARLGAMAGAYGAARLAELKGEVFA